MRLLLDSHVLLWFVMEPEKLRQTAFGQINARDNDVAYSGVSLSEFPITTRYGLAAAALPRHHSDPFDRLLIAQARIEKLTLVTRDRMFHDYDVQLLEA